MVSFSKSPAAIGDEASGIFPATTGPLSWIVATLSSEAAQEEAADAIVPDDDVRLDEVKRLIVKTEKMAFAGLCIHCVDSTGMSHETSQTSLSEGMNPFKNASWGPSSDSNLYSAFTNNRV